MSSPFFTPGRHVAGQMAIPMGTHHACPTCHNSHVCDVADCSLPLGEPCQQCGPATPHSQRPQDTRYIRLLRIRLAHHESFNDEYSKRLAAELRRQIALAQGEPEGDDGEQPQEAEQGSLF
jgi:hypothetical protein